MFNQQNKFLFHFFLSFSTFFAHFFFLDFEPDGILGPWPFPPPPPHEVTPLITDRLLDSRKLMVP